MVVHARVVEDPLDEIVRPAGRGEKAFWAMTA